MIRDTEPTQMFRLAQQTANGRLWLFKRNCSLAPQQMLMVFGALALVSMSIAVFFWWHGAVLVVPFAVAELMALAFAFYMYCRHATDREVIRVEPTQVVVEYECAGRSIERRFSREWIRVSTQRGSGGLVEISSAGQSVLVGQYLRPEWRTQLARELRYATASAM